MHDNEAGGTALMQRAARAVAVAGLLLACGREVPEGLLEQFRSDLAERAEAAARRDSIVVGGLDDWLFLGPELRHVAAGRFRGDEARQPAAGGDPARAAPLPAILDFQRQLDARGVDLLLVPVPPKSIIYPEKAAAGVDVPIPVPRLDAAHEAFYGLLREQGVDVLDLTDHFLANRFHPEGTPYCRQDSHWSGVGCVLAGEAIAAAVRDRSWYPELATTAFTPRWYSAHITGDLYSALDSPDVPREEVRLRGVAAAGTRPAAAAVPDPESPIVLLGDSHNLVFQAGADMHATGAGLADQLAFELGLAVDLIAVPGSGATAARVELRRRAEQDAAFWARKRLVVWCFAAREFTEGDGWALVPVVPGAAPGR